MAPSCVSLYLSNLPSDWTWREHAALSIGELSAIPKTKCKWTHGPEVNTYVDANRRTIASRATTLTISGEAKRLELFEEQLRNRSIVTNTPPSRDITVDHDFYGVCLLYETPRSTVDIYFIHGLEGHAFNTWTSHMSNDDPSTVRCWPRDFLPHALHEKGIKANIYTIGYNARIFSNPDVDATITTAAESIIALLESHRKSGSIASQRPMYFVCHSLGGLVLSQALILILSDQHASPSLSRRYRDLFISETSDCLVKGICYMGTPFKGSPTANVTSPIVAVLQKMLPTATNDQLVRSLRSGKLGELDTIAREINYVRQELDIEIVIAREGDVVFGRQPVVNLASAQGYFGGQTAAINLNGDHREIARYSQKSQIYEALQQGIINMILRSPARPEQRPRRSDSNVPTAQGMGMQTEPQIQEIGSASRAATMPASVPLQQTYPPGFGGVNLIFQGYGNLPVHPAPWSLHNEEQHSRNGRSSSGGRPGSDDTHAGSPGSSRDGGHLGERTSTPPSSPPLSQGSPPGATGVMPKKQVEDKGKFTKLRKYDTVFIIDDSHSMDQPADRKSKVHPIQKRWELLKTSLRETVVFATKYDKDGVDVIFLNSEDLDESNVTDPQKITDKLDEVGQLLFAGAETLQGTLYYDALDKAISQKVIAYRNVWESRRHGGGAHQKWPKPLNIIFITDGESDDRDETKELLMNTAQQLNAMRAPKRWIGIQFVQIGDDKGASKWLKELDDELKNEPVMEGRDMVDTTTFLDKNSMTEQEFTKLLIKILLGGVQEDIDDLG